MAHVVVIGAGIGGLPAAFELRHLLPRSHQITLISASPKFTFIPSLPWVTFGLTALSNIQVDLHKTVTHRGIGLVIGSVTQIDPVNQEITVGETVIPYDFVLIATGAELGLDAVPGLGPEDGYTQSICNPHHAEMARDAWAKFLTKPGPLVVGAVPGAGCLGPVYEFAMLADYVLRRHHLRDQVPITLLTPEPYAGHLGIGGMANSSELVKRLLTQREINWVDNAAISHIDSHKIRLADGQHFPFDYAMLLPPFRGPAFARKAGLGDEQGLISVLPTGQHPDYDSIYAAGVVVKIPPPEKTPVPVGVPKTGQMTEAMVMAATHNIAIKLGAISGRPQQPTLEATCFADFGNTGIAFLACPVLPDPITGKRRKAVALEGRWVSWSKIAFEKFFLTKMHWGLAVPWFERWGLKLLGLSLIEPLSEPLASREITHTK